MTRIEEILMRIDILLGLIVMLIPVVAMMLPGGSDMPDFLAAFPFAVGSLTSILILICAIMEGFDWA